MGDRIAHKMGRVKRALLKSPKFHDPKLRGFVNKACAGIDQPGVTRTERPRGPDGAESFHFKHDVLCRRSLLALAKGRKGKSDKHQRYIEREKAAEHFTATWDQMRALGGDLRQSRSGDFQAYIERPGAGEQVGEFVAAFGNLAETVEERIAYWAARDAREFLPKVHTLELYPERDAVFWHNVDADPAAPSVLKARNTDRFSAVEVSDAEAADIFTYHKSHTTLAKIYPKAVSFEEGPAGRVQTRLVVDLPCELAAIDRLDLAQQLCAKLFSRPSDNLEDVNAPRIRYHATIHKPNEGNDGRNNHLHIVFDEQPAGRRIHPLTGKLEWDFLIEVPVKDASYKTRLRRPYKQRKDRRFNHKEWLWNSRCAYAALANDMLKKRGFPKRYDPRSHEEAGIAEPARPRILKHAYATAKKGVITPQALPAIDAIWQRRLRLLEKEHPTVAYPRDIDGKFGAEMKRWFGKLMFGRLARTRLEWRQHTYNEKLFKQEAAAGHYVVDRIASIVDPPLKRASDEERALIAELREEHAGQWETRAAHARAKRIGDEGVLAAAGRLDAAKHDGRSLETRKRFGEFVPRTPSLFKDGVGDAIRKSLDLNYPMPDYTVPSKPRAPPMRPEEIAELMAVLNGQAASAVDAATSKKTEADEPAQRAAAKNAPSAASPPRPSTARPPGPGPTDPGRRVDAQGPTARTAEQVAEEHRARARPAPIVEPPVRVQTRPQAAAPSGGTPGPMDGRHSHPTPLPAGAVPAEIRTAGAPPAPSAAPPRMRTPAEVAAAPRAEVTPKLPAEKPARVEQRKRRPVPLEANSAETQTQTAALPPPATAAPDSKNAASVPAISDANAKAVRRGARMDMARNAAFDAAASEETRDRAAAAPLSQPRKDEVQAEAPEPTPAFSAPEVPKQPAADVDENAARRKKRKRETQRTRERVIHAQRNKGGRGK